MSLATLPLEKPLSIRTQDFSPSKSDLKLAFSNDQWQDIQLFSYRLISICSGIQPASALGNRNLYVRMMMPINTHWRSMLEFLSHVKVSIFKKADEETYDPGKSYPPINFIY